MAFPTGFDEENGDLGPPKGCSEDEVSSLSVLQTKYDDGTPVVISCWKLTQEELEEVIRTKRVWLGIHGSTMPPAWVSGLNPTQTQEKQ